MSAESRELFSIAEGTWIRPAAVQSIVACNSNEIINTPHVTLRTAYDLVLTWKFETMDAAIKHADTLAQRCVYYQQNDNPYALIDKALAVAMDTGAVDGAHHKAWVIDQMVRALTGSVYQKWVESHNEGVDGPDTYQWDEGTAP